MATILSAKLKVKQAININFKQSAVNVRLAARFSNVDSACGRDCDFGYFCASKLPHVFYNLHDRGWGQRKWNRMIKTLPCATTFNEN